VRMNVFDFDLRIAEFGVKECDHMELVER
jgi:hypothetical protein